VKFGVLVLGVDLKGESATALATRPRTSGFSIFLLQDVSSSRELKKLQRDALKIHEIK